MAVPDPSLPWLLRGATRRFGGATRARLEAVGIDLPHTGVWAVRALDEHDRTATELVSVLSLSKQAVSVLVDGLVEADLVERQPHPDDRRRVLLTLTEHGRIAAKVIRTASTAVERELAQQVSAHDLAALRRALAVLASDT